VKLLGLVLLVLLSSASAREDDFPTLSDQLLWKTEQEVCKDPYECVGLSHMSIRCCRIRIGLV
jgi:hypothetical protein